MAGRSIAHCRRRMLCVRCGPRWKQRWRSRHGVTHAVLGFRGVRFGDGRSARAGTRDGNLETAVHARVDQSYPADAPSHTTRASSPAVSAARARSSSGKPISLSTALLRIVTIPLLTLIAFTAVLLWETQKLLDDAQLV